MSAPKHTAGPWERLEGFAEKGHPSYVEGRLIIRIVQKRAPGQTEFVKIALVDAGPVADNARLIAAAPDLLEAAQKVLEANDRVVEAMMAAKTGAEAQRIAQRGSDEFTATLPALRTAVAKATGEAA